MRIKVGHGSCKSQRQAIRKTFELVWAHYEKGQMSSNTGSNGIREAFQKKKKTKVALKGVFVQVMRAQEGKREYDCNCILQKYVSKQNAIRADPATLFN